MDDLLTTPRRICGATTSAGTPCQRSPLPLARRCRFHGDATPQSRHAQEVRKLALIDPALDIIADILERRPVCEVCNRRDDPALQLRAAQALLDRAGHHPSLAIQVAPEPEQLPCAAWITSDELKTIAQILAAAEGRMLRGEPTHVSPLRLVPPVEVIDGDMATIDVTPSIDDGLCPQAEMTISAETAPADDAKAQITQGLDDDSE
jgi:hypothetical protein